MKTQNQLECVFSWSSSFLRGRVRVYFLVHFLFFFYEFPALSNIHTYMFKWTNQICRSRRFFRLLSDCWGGCAERNERCSQRNGHLFPHPANRSNRSVQTLQSIRNPRSKFCRDIYSGHFPNFCPNWKTGKNLKKDLKKGREKWWKKEKSDKTHVKIPL